MNAKNNFLTFFKKFNISLLIFITFNKKISFQLYYKELHI